MQKYFKIKLLFIMFFFLNCSASHAWEIIASNKSPCEDHYSLINKATILQSEENHLTIKLFETGGGDPAVNGNKLVLHINQWEPMGNSYTWSSGIDVYEVKEVGLKNNGIIIYCIKHITENESGSIKMIPSRYNISYFFNEAGKLKRFINVEEEE